MSTVLYMLYQCDLLWRIVISDLRNIPSKFLSAMSYFISRFARYASPRWGRQQEITRHSIRSLKARKEETRQADRTDISVPAPTIPWSSSIKEANGLVQRIMTNLSYIQTLPVASSSSNLHSFVHILDYHWCISTNLKSVWSHVPKNQILKC